MQGCRRWLLQVDNCFVEVGLTWTLTSALIYFIMLHSFVPISNHVLVNFRVRDDLKVLPQYWQIQLFYNFFVPKWRRPPRLPLKLLLKGELPSSLFFLTQRKKACLALLLLFLLPAVLFVGRAPESQDSKRMKIKEGPLVFTRNWPQLLLSLHYSLDDAEGIIRRFCMNWKSMFWTLLN